jgi:hypothetical protein
MKMTTKPTSMGKNIMMECPFPFKIVAIRWSANVLTAKKTNYAGVYGKERINTRERTKTTQRRSI